MTWHKPTYQNPIPPHPENGADTVKKSSPSYYHGAGANGPIAGAKKEKHGKPAHHVKPRLNPTLLALHMQQAKNPSIRCIEEPRQPRSDSVFPLKFSRN